MLLTSSGDSDSALSVNSLPSPLDSTLDSQSGIEGDRALFTAPVDTTAEGDRAQPECKDDLSSTYSNFASNTTITSSGIHTTGAKPLTQLPHRQRAWLKVPPQNALDELYALRQAAGAKTLPRSRNSWSAGTLARLTQNDTTEASDLASFAAPLSPLRERDLKALSELFLRDDIYAIEGDVKQRLLSLLPEPCWEDNVFDFLKEFL